MGYMSHTNDMSSGILRRLPQQANSGGAVIHCTVDFVSIALKGFFSCTTPFILMLITSNKGCYNHVVDTYVVMFIITIDTSWISTSSLQVYVKLIKNKVSNIFWFLQTALLIKYHMFSWTLLIIQCCQDEASSSYWCLFVLSGKYSENSCFSAYNSEHWWDAIDVSYIVK